MFCLCSIASTNQAYRFCSQIEVETISLMAKVMPPQFFFWMGLLKPDVCIVEQDLYSLS